MSMRRIAKSLLGIISIRGSIALCEQKHSSCKDTVCSSKLEIFREAVRLEQKHPKANKLPSETSNLTSNSVLKPEEANNLAKGIMKCPIDRVELGQSTWNLIHTLAAYYPDDPTQEEKLSAVGFISSLSQLYPCKICQPHFQQYVEENPPM